VQFINLHGVVDYYVAAPEVGEKGTPHIQFYIAFKQQTRLSKLKKLLPVQIHWSIKRGTCLQASNYCKKGDGPWTQGGLKEKDPLFGLNVSPDLIEYGVLPEEQQVAGGKATEEIWAHNMELALAGKFEEMTPSHQVLHYNKYLAHKERNRPKPKRLTWKRGESPNLWIYGPTGTGKSYKARELYPNIYEKMLNKWWENYNDEKEVLLEDVGQSHAAWIGDFIKRWADIYPFQNERKFGSLTIRPEVIVVTSNYSIQELFPDPNVHGPLLDRFQLMHLTEKYDARPPPNYPMFDVVKELFAVDNVDDMPIGPRNRNEIIIPDTDDDRSVDVEYVSEGDSS